LICHSSAAISALNDVVIAELDVYAEKPDAPAALHAAIGAWAPKRASGFDLSTISAVLDLLSLGFIGEARDLLLTASSTRQLTFTTERSAYLVARVEGEIAAGHYQRAAASLVELDREYPCSSGADLMITSQAIRINAACGDPDDVQVIERRLARSSGAVLTYPARGAHAAAQGFRQLVLGNYRESRDLLSLALHGPALLLQGRTCALADLVEAAVADGDRADALAMLDQHSSWLPDIDGDRAAGLIARCRALVADPSEIDRMFATALDQHGTTHEVDRARTLVAYGRSLMAADRGAEAARPLGEAIATFRQGRLFGWERHAHTLLEQSRSFGVRDPSWPLDQLNEMERQILALVLQRKRNREIAASLFVSLRTVEGHLTRLFRKFGVSTKAQLLRQVAADRETGREPA
jgi:DNA-binding CsgD family transcriptional regulator